MSAGTSRHDYSDWERFLKDDPITKRPLKELTIGEFSKWFKGKLKTGIVDKKTKELKPFTTTQAKAMRSLLNNVFQFAVENEYINENLSTKLGRFRYEKYCQNITKKDSEQVYQDNEPTQLMSLAFQYFQETYNFAYMAVIFLFLMDLRAGEVVALKFSDLEDRKGYIHIQRQEVPNVILNKETGKEKQQGVKLAEHTKTYEDRYVKLSATAIAMVDFG